MPKKHMRDRCEAARLELIEHRGEVLMETTVAGCALIAHADGEVAPAETQRMLAIMRTDPRLSMFPFATRLGWPPPDDTAARGDGFALIPTHFDLDSYEGVGIPNGLKF